MSVEALEKPSPALDAFRTRATKKTDLFKTTLPTRKVEAWHYTSLRSVDDIKWHEAEAIPAEQVSALLESLSLPQTKSRIVFANGRRQEQYSHQSDQIKSNAGFSFPVLKQNFTALLNESLGTEGVTLTVPAGVDAGTLALVSLTQGAHISTHLHHKIVLEEGASLKLFDIHVGEGSYLTNPRFDIVVKENAHLHHVKIQKESPESTHLGIVSVQVEERGNYDSFTLNKGGHLARHEVVAVLNGRHASVHVNGIQVVDGTRLNDLTSMIHHAAPDCNSRQTVKTVLSESGQGVFQGKILVDQVAQKTDGYQMNQALLLSEKAQINSKPELEIYADDVKCSHGATVGALDDEQLFYLRSRGIPEAQAREILVQAFLIDALDLVADEEIREVLLRSISL
ncbi:Fe-S cluster assembly protein SufD [Swingsia samuiensis]|uniref:Fe-S cluster assembly protein SufD n=1 Tax=Swingsia samuiensis TaxID=1293412 RepID=A0A4Y6UIM1_9PROT|nr:Fe-S cluster assembly protein SufD [Swingsia samuiensis]QDH16217.1 Fe-S cluster assembly protein SufD [Swingsia samuiensis]